MVKMNVSKSILTKSSVFLPSMKAPTVNELFGGEGYAVETVVPKDQINILIPELEDQGHPILLKYLFQNRSLIPSNSELFSSKQKWLYSFGITNAKIWKFEILLRHVWPPFSIAVHRTEMSSKSKRKVFPKLFLRRSRRNSFGFEKIFGSLISGPYVAITFERSGILTPCNEISSVLVRYK